LPLAAGSLEQPALAVVAREQAVLEADPEGVVGELVDDDGTADVLGPPADRRCWSIWDRTTKRGKGSAPAAPKARRRVGLGRSVVCTNGRARGKRQEYSRLWLPEPSSCLVNYRVPIGFCRFSRQFWELPAERHIPSHDRARQARRRREEREAGGAGATLGGARRAGAGWVSRGKNGIESRWCPGLAVVSHGL
jgi:hypothetical protein